MKIIGRVIMIWVVFAGFAGLMVTAVNASGLNAPDFDGAPQFRPDGDDDGGFRLERNEEREGGGSRWMFGLIKNVGMMAVLVTVIILPKSVAKKNKKKRAVSTNL